MITSKINNTRIKTKLEENPVVHVGVLVTVWHPHPHWLFILSLLFYNILCNIYQKGNKIGKIKKALKECFSDYINYLTMIKSTVSSVSLTSQVVFPTLSMLALTTFNEETISSDDKEVFSFNTSANWAVVKVSFP